MKRLILFFAFIAACTPLFAQQLQLTPELQRKNHYRYRAIAEGFTSYKVSPGRPFTSVAVKAAKGSDFTGAAIIYRTDTFPVIKDPHVSEGSPFDYSNLIVFDQPVMELTFVSGALSGEVIFVLLHNENLQIDRIRARYKQTGECEEPAAIDQSEWREGLDAPSYNRIQTDVEHIIVHHSATSNSLTNYTNVVRNIYRFHTEERQWSDIGYNYLVAPDGTIYKGRDPGQLEQDETLGAHFCGANSGTMGVCVLGTYNTVEPTEASLEAIVRLAAWKTLKEGLDPEGLAPHPLNATLHVIAGHRDGCATLCPGDMLYAQLDEIRVETDEYAAACEAGEEPEEPGEPETPEDTLNEEEIVQPVFPVPASDEIHVYTGDEDATISQMHFVDITGRKVAPPDWEKNGAIYTVSTTLLRPGVYILHVELSNGFTLTRKVVIVKN